MNELEGKSPFAPGFEPVQFDTSDIRDYIQGAKVEYAHEMKKYGFIQIILNNRFIRYDEVTWYAYRHDLMVDTIYALPDKENPETGKIQINLYRGWRNPVE